jgi:hypothetical protein
VSDTQKNGHYDNINEVQMVRKEILFSLSLRDIAVELTKSLPAALSVWFYRLSCYRGEWFQLQG